LLFNHRHVALMVEDLYSNCVTYIYMALTNFLPPWLLSSNAILALGDQGVLEAQNGFTCGCESQIAPHYHFLWHFQAGMVFIAFAYLSCRLAARCVQRPTAMTVCLAAACIMIWTGFSTH